MRVCIKVESVDKTARKSRLRWLGHVLRIGENRLLKSICFSKTERNVFALEAGQDSWICNLNFETKGVMNGKEKLCGWLEAVVTWSVSYPLNTIRRKSLNAL